MDLLLQVTIPQQLLQIIVSIQRILRMLDRLPNAQRLVTRQLREQHVLLRDDANGATRQAGNATFEGDRA